MSTTVERQPIAADAVQPARALPTRLTAAVSGIIAAGAALAVGELIAAFLSGAPSPIAAVGAAVIDFAPPGSKEVAVALFGTNDKPAILVLITLVVIAVGAGLGLLARRRPAFALAGIVAVALFGTNDKPAILVLITLVVIAVGAGLGLLARRRPAFALAGIVALVGIGLLAMLRLPDAEPTASLFSAAVQAIVGIQVLMMLLGAAPREGVAPTAATGRRPFLARALGLGALAVVGGGIGRAMVEGRATQVAVAVTEIPQAVQPVSAPGPESSFDVAGITPLVVPNGDFYRIDTALVTPSVNLATWSLRVHGMVDTEVNLTFDQLVELPLIEQYVTIACVSNEVGGDLVGNAKWTGVRLTDVLDMAGVQAGATQIVPRSVDGWTAGFPTAWVTAPERPREAMIAVKMNDEPLPAPHGFPARLIVPGLYGYVSATKWLSDIELTTLEAFDAYWVPRGWSKEAPILTQSRIDVPLWNSGVSAGPVAVAGVAWAPDRGISRVEVRVDDGEWQDATIATPIGPQTWVQWKLAWQAEPGEHFIAVRATDGAGEVQSDQVTPPDPDGARGYHTIGVRVA